MFAADESWRMGVMKGRECNCECVKEYINGNNVYINQPPLTSTRTTSPVPFYDSLLEDWTLNIC
jgi:hypothetical protein